jgi:hypothetical protein
VFWSNPGIFIPGYLGKSRDVPSLSLFWSNENKVVPKTAALQVPAVKKENDREKLKANIQSIFYAFFPLK